MHKILDYRNIAFDLMSKLTEKDLQVAPSQSKTHPYSFTNIVAGQHSFSISILLLLNSNKASDMFSLITTILAVQVAQAAPLFTRQALTPDLTVVKVDTLSFLFWGSLIVVRSPC